MSLRVLFCPFLRYLPVYGSQDISLDAIGLHEIGR
jgi:hypothetical protein